MTKGKLIILEGVDGSGLTTQSHLLVDYLTASGYPSCYNKEPTQGAVGRMIREVLQHKLEMDPKALALLFAADRLEHCALIESHLDAGTNIVCDRYVLSSFVYQAKTEDDLDWVQAINSHCLRPDLTLFVRVPADVAHERRVARGLPTELFEMNDVSRAALACFDNLTIRDDLSDYLGEVQFIVGRHSVEDVQADIQHVIKRWFWRQDARNEARDIARAEALKAVREAFLGVS